MCKALEDLKNECKAEGTIITLKNLVKDGVLTLEAAAKRANMTVTEFKEKAEQYA